MSFRINHQGEFWNGGVFCVPKSINESINFADELKLKTLLLILGGEEIDAEAIAKRLSASKSSIEECFEFWAGEGILTDGKEAPAPIKEEPKKAPVESLPMPNYSNRDIIALSEEEPEIAEMLRESEVILADFAGVALKSNLINMVKYYGLPVPVVLTILKYYKSERDKGKNVTTRTIQNIAKEWAQEEINTLEKASAKLDEMNAIEELWSDVLAQCELDFRKPNSAQKKMLARWKADFDGEMIFFACNTMKKYTEESQKSIKQVDNILKEWKRKGFKNPDDVKSKPEKKKSGDKIKSAPSFDVDKLKKRAELNDDYDV